MTKTIKLIEDGTETEWLEIDGTNLCIIGQDQSRYFKKIEKKTEEKFPIKFGDFKLFENGIINDVSIQRTIVGGDKSGDQEAEDLQLALTKRKELLNNEKI